MRCLRSRPCGIQQHFPSTIGLSVARLRNRVQRALRRQRMALECDLAKHWLELFSHGKKRLAPKIEDRFLQHDGDGSRITYRRLAELALETSQRTRARTKVVLTG